MTPHKHRREAMARLLAAALMGLIKDPTGINLPEDCWMQMLPKADATLFIATNGQTPYQSDSYHGPG